MALAADLAAALDPVLLARAAGIVPDEWQARVLRSTSPRILLNCSRQAGKSTVTSISALHVALYDPGSLVLIISRSERQSGELFRKCLATYRALGRPVPAVSEGTLHLELENGSRIIGLPGKEETTRSFSGVKLLAIDEAARVPDDLYRSVRPMLAVSGGRLIALSTPWGKRGWWHQEWTEGGPTWERYHITAEQCPRISAEFLAEERHALGEWFYRQEYMGEFSETSDHLFAHEDVMAAITSAVEPLFS